MIYGEKIPIYQMSMYSKEDKDPKGLIFASEVEDLQSQSFYYCIPINKRVKNVVQLIRYFENKYLYMPFSINNELQNIYAKLFFPYIIFDFPKELKTNTNFKLTLEPIVYRKYLRRTLIPTILEYTRKRLKTYKYIGGWNQIDKNNSRFLIILPESDQMIPVLFNEYNILPIGKTIKYGVEESIKVHEY